MNEYIILKSNFENNECIICLENMVVNEAVEILNCGHIYHYKCIIEWLNINSSCPHCRKKITRNDIVSFLYENYNIDLTIEVLDDFGINEIFLEYNITKPYYLNQDTTSNQLSLLKNSENNKSSYTIIKIMN